MCFFCCCFFLFCRFFLPPLFFSCLFVYCFVFATFHTFFFFQKMFCTSLFYVCFFFFCSKTKCHEKKVFLPLPSSFFNQFSFYLLLLFLFPLNAFSTKNEKLEKMILFITLVDTPPIKMCFSLFVLCFKKEKGFLSLRKTCFHSVFVFVFCRKRIFFALPFETLLFISLCSSLFLLSSFE